MQGRDLYVPMNQLILDKESHWTFININLPYATIAEKGILMWCIENMKCRWTMLGGSKFGFEDSQDALMFKFQFGL